MTWLSTLPVFHSRPELIHSEWNVYLQSVHFLNDSFPVDLRRFTFFWTRPRLPIRALLESKTDHHCASLLRSLSDIFSLKYTIILMRRMQIFLREQVDTPNASTPKLPTPTPNNPTPYTLASNSQNLNTHSQLPTSQHPTAHPTPNIPSPNCTPNSQEVIPARVQHPQSHSQLPTLTPNSPTPNSHSKLPRSHSRHPTPTKSFPNSQLPRSHFQLRTCNSHRLPKSLVNLEVGVGGGNEKVQLF